MRESVMFRKVYAIKDNKTIVLPLVRLRVFGRTAYTEDGKLVKLINGKWIWIIQEDKK